MNTVVSPNGVPAPGAALPAGVALGVRAPWLGAAGWRAEGTDARGRPVRARHAAAAAAPGGPLLPVALPAGFSGRVTLLDARGAALGELRLKDLGGPGFSATSPDLEVQAHGAAELRVERLQADVQCYLRAPAALQVRRALSVDAAGAWQVHQDLGPHGVSLRLARAFRGRVLLQDARESGVLELRVQRLGQADGVQARTLPGWRAQVRSSPRLLDVAVLPQRFNAVPR